MPRTILASWLVIVLLGCGGASATGEGTGGEGGGEDVSSGDGSEASGETSSEETSDEGGASSPAVVDVVGDGIGVGAVVSDSHTTPPYTRCEGQPAGACAECAAPGLVVSIRGSSSRTWRAGEYTFELLTEGHHIRCPVTLPCESAAPVVCNAAEGAPRVMIETTGCGGPPAEQAVTALRFPADACPSEVALEAFRDGIRIGRDTTTPRYRSAPACGGSCSTAQLQLTVR
jgi:hypothetical protein